MAEVISEQQLPNSAGALFPAPQLSPGVRQGESLGEKQHLVFAPLPIQEPPRKLGAPFLSL